MNLNVPPVDLLAARREGMSAGGDGLAAVAAAAASRAAHYLRNSKVEVEEMLKGSKWV